MESMDIANTKEIRPLNPVPGISFVALVASFQDLNALATGRRGDYLCWMNENNILQMCEHTSFPAKGHFTQFEPCNEIDKREAQLWTGKEALKVFHWLHS